MDGIRGDTNSVSVTIERKSRYMVSGLITKKSQSKSDNLIKRLKQLPVLTITTDNGSENAGHKIWQQELDAEVYFCNAYHSWEKGAIENAIGRLRRVIPKKRSLEDLSYQKLAYYTHLYNHTPRKCLNYLTPHEAFMLHFNPP